MNYDIQVGDIVKMRKQHPCGGWLWEVTRIGADIGLLCQTCQRRVMLSRRELNNRAKTIVSNPNNAEAPTHPPNDALKGTLEQ